MSERCILYKLVNEHIDTSKLVVRRTMCDFVKHSFGDRKTGKWETEPWTVAQSPMSARNTSFTTSPPTIYCAAQLPARWH